MKVIYFSAISTSDCDFPLLKAFQDKKLDFAAYYTLTKINHNQGLIYSKDFFPKDCIMKAADVPSFAIYSNYLNLDNIYVINLLHYKRKQWQYWFMWIKVLIHIIKQKPTVFHIVWPLLRASKLLYFLRCKKILTVHDPFPHSGLQNSSNEKCRQLAFKKCDKLILLNEVQENDFIKHYHIKPHKIAMARLGSYDCLKYQNNIISPIKEDYILFFGQIQSHKGIDILLSAMEFVHSKFPNIKLVVAGKGDFHFDISYYKKLNYIEFRNYYITIPELSSLLQNCLFAVCPYKDATQSGVVQTAFSASVPLIVTNVGSLPRVVTHNSTGLIIPPNDINSLAYAIEKLLLDRDLLIQFRKNIEEKWLPNMDWHPIADIYIDNYKELTHQQE